MNNEQYNAFMNFYFQSSKMFAHNGVEKKQYQNQKVDPLLLIKFADDVKKAKLPFGDDMKFISSNQAFDKGVKFAKQNKAAKMEMQLNKGFKLLNEVLYNVPIKTALTYYNLDDDRFVVKHTEDIQEIKYKGNLVGITTDVQSEEDFYSMPISVIQHNLDSYEQWFEELVIEKYEEWLEVSNPNKAKNKNI